MAVPTVSVMIPIYNRQADAERAIASVLDQTFEWTELLLVDDCSTPPFELPEKWRANKKIKLIRCETNGGASRARNRAIDVATSDFIAALDSDDTWHPEKLERQMAAVSSCGVDWQKELVVFVSSFQLGSSLTKKMRTLTPISTASASDLVSAVWYAPGSTALYPRRVFDEIGVFDPDIPLAEDLDLFARLGLSGGQLICVPDALALIGEAGGASLAKVRKSYATAIRKYKRDPKWSALITAPQLRRMKAFLALSTAKAALESRNYWVFLQQLALTWIYVPRMRPQLGLWWDESEDGPSNSL